MLHKLMKMIEGVVKYRPHTAAQDKLSPPGNVYNSSSAQLIQRGKVGTTEFSNLLASMAFPHADSVSGPLRADIIYTRTTPLGDTDYASLPFGSLCIFQTVASKAVTDGAIHLKTKDSFGNLLHSSRPVVVSTATLALGTASTSWHGMKIKSTIPTGIDLSAYQNNGLYIETEVLGTGKTGAHYGIKLETYVESGATVGDHSGMAIFTYDNRAGTKNGLDVIHLEHNGAAVGGAFLGLFNATNKIQYLLQSTQTDNLWCSHNGAVSNAAGWLRIKLGGYTKYITLNDTGA